MRKRCTENGDTLIEVLFAVTIFSLVAVGSLSLMNQGLSMAQRSLEITQVRQQLDGQAEILRYVHDRARAEVTGPYATLWNQITVSSASQSFLNASTCPTNFPSNGFAFITTASGVQLASQYTEPGTYAKIVGTRSEGLSVQLVKVDGDGAYDAYIQACWYSVGIARPMTTGTIVRLYDPSA